ncbi:pyrroline-5-carboxylate reductase, putative [Talaromyces stipitatus ATCC 10500]|uniref:Pyrroline-5-carboxylate reductase, putative n=1 Tax=Talaromyces stipitatus (strain ATCC 10500 / CBS 375.48 / QM 6759 / NRRL 1006) TaxID=441959 RepID=B8M3Q3_TALSN|nr:pyrroline-5-carboxylate reductase, putative [Talaromyces stipitatus ATCC 10500]EED20646.1 pyrroline-5-carboxylate reductase, putative [Talaromyces stipitatus ATCC 10500]
MRGGTTLAIIGCGQIGTSILEVLLTTLSQPCPNQQHNPLPILSMKLKPSRFIACVISQDSVSRLRTKFGHFARSSYPNVQISQGRVVEVVQQADIILLTLQASQGADLLSDPSLREHLAGKLLLSTCADLSVQQIEQLIYNDAIEEGGTVSERCFIVQAIPNTAAGVRQSATLISETVAGADTTLPPDFQSLTTWIFSSIGTVTYMPESLMNSASMISGLAPAFYTVALEGIAKEAIARGLSEPDALFLAAQALKGTAEMVLSKKEENKGLFALDEVRDQAIASSNGSGARGTLVLRQATVKDSFAEAMSQGMEKRDTEDCLLSVTWL